MTKNTPPVAVAERGWIREVVETWNDLARDGKQPDGPALAAALAQRLNISSTLASGLISGVDTLLSYAEMESDKANSALEEERSSVQAALRAVRPLLEARLQHRLDEADTLSQEVICRGCGHSPRSQGRRDRGFQSTVGKLRLKRRYWWCAECGQGSAPAQKEVGLPDSDYTAGLEEVTTLMATTVPHQMAVGLVEKLLGLEVSPQGVKSSVERRAEQVIKLASDEAEEIKSFEQKWQKSPPYITEQAPKTQIKVAYLELDGVIVPTREEAAGSGEDRKGRGGPGRKYEVRGREVKNAIVYEDSACARESETRGCLLEKSYISHLGDWMGLAMLVWAVMLKRGVDRAELIVVLSDGAEWIRSLSKWLRVPVLLILDLYHIKHKLWGLASAIYGEEKQRVKEWAEQQCERIEEGRAGEVIEELEKVKSSQPKAREQIEEVETYLRNNKDRMDYPKYRAMGLRVGSGAIESTNYHVTGARLKLPGMRWSEDGAAQMARLRADLFNGVWQDRSRQILKAA